MKRGFLAILMLLLACSLATAADYVRIDKDSIVMGSTTTMSTYILRECPTPAKLLGISTAFKITTTGTSWEYASGGVVVDPVVHGWMTLGGIILGETGMNPGVPGQTTGNFTLGGAAMAPGGMPIIATEQHYFDLTLAFANTEGQFCIDSGLVGSVTWKFSGMTCGPEADPARPRFLAKDGSDANHPICMPVFEQQCEPPVINVTPVGDQLTMNHCNPVSFTFGAALGGLPGNPGDPLTWAVTAGLGGFIGNVYTMPAQPTGSYPVTIQVTNDCGGTDTYDFTVVFTNQPPSITNCSGLPATIGRPGVVNKDFNASDANTCDPLTWSVAVAPATLHVPTIDGTGLFHWDVDVAEVPFTYAFTVTVQDGQGGSAVCEFSIEVLSSDPFEVQLEKVEDQFQGHYSVVSIFLNKGSEYFGGFDFLVAYDASALTFISAALGPDLNGCWEFFTYRYGWDGNCSGPCPSGMLEVIGMADINNGPHHPDVSCMIYPQVPEYQMSLVDLTFYVTNDRTYDCMYVPIRFFWHACSDNAISNVMGDTLWIDKKVMDYDWTLGYRDITGQIHYGGHAWLGDCQNPDPLKPSPIPFIDFIHGGIDIICADSIDLRGDINLNNVANDIADAVLYTNYFIYGLGVFDINVEGQIAASDVNNDGKVLTVGDLVYIVRILTGDALPYPKLSPYANTVDVSYGDVVTAKSATDIGAAMFVFEGEGTPVLLADGMQMKADVVNGQTRVLVWSDNTNRIQAGESQILGVSGMTLVETSFADYNGNMMNVNMAKVVPTAFSLKQNYPNPFNPSTNISIYLPTQADWKLDIYNVAGQLVKSFSGNDRGEVTVTWDAKDVASGIYFYKATTGQYTDTKKMVLMK